MHYYERQEKDRSLTLVLLHGLGTSSSTWVHVLPKLDPQWTVFALDLPGFGFSSLRNGGRFLGFDELLGSVASFIEQRVGGPFVLLGHSLGGWLAAKYAARNKSTIRRLILVNNAGILDDRTTAMAKAFDVTTWVELSRLLNTLWFRYPWYFKPFYPAILRDLRKRHVPDFVRSIHPGDFVNNDLHSLKMNVDIVWGKEDRLITMQSVEIMQRAMPAARVHLIDKCGHVPQLERPREFTVILRDLLRQESGLPEGLNTSRGVHVP